VGVTERDTVLGDRYRLVRRVATGGMGAVWEAEDTVLHRPVAVKVLAEGLAEDAAAAERFRREARAAAGLSHPNVAGVFDYGEDGRAQFLVMELIDGETLADRIRRTGPLTPEEAAAIAAEVADALGAAHEAGLVHRDVKPGNIMLTRRGDVKVMDFGIAAAQWASRLTASGTTIGTAAYISPEQAAGDHVTPASDIYSLGVVLYEMLAGRPPFQGGSPVAVASAHINGTPPPLRDVAPAAPKDLAAACEQALAKDPAARPHSAAAFAAMLRGGRAEATSAPGAAAPATGDGDGDGRDPTTTRILTAPTGTAVLPTGPPETPPDGAAAVGTPPGRRRARPRARRWYAVLLGLGLLVLAAVTYAAVRGTTGPPPPPAHTPSPQATTVAVPKVAGMSVADATAALEDRGLVVGKVVDVPGPTGEVVRTDPPAGDTIDPSTPVTLYVGSGEGGDHHEKGKGKGKGEGH
jgi:eukaryotic-like serine/threonine-protein kinase